MLQNSQRVLCISGSYVDTLPIRVRIRSSMLCTRQGQPRQPTRDVTHRLLAVAILLICYHGHVGWGLAGIESNIFGL